MQGKQLDSAIACGQAFLDSYTSAKSTTRPFQVIKRVLQYCRDHSDGTAEFIEFTWQDIAEDSDIQNEGKALKRHLSSAIDILSDHMPGLSQVALDMESEWIPILTRQHQGSGAGNRNLYRLGFEVAQTNELIDKSEVPAGFIRYTLESVAKPSWLGRRVHGLVNRGMVWAGIAGAVIVVMTAAWIAFSLGLLMLLYQTSVHGMLQVILSMLIWVAVAYVLIGPLYGCVTRRIIMAPILLAPFGFQNKQLEYMKTGESRADGRPYRQFRLVSYMATCPFCNGRVEVDHGSWGVGRRLVGRCSESPREHVYSFDHVTRLGQPIYSEYRSLMKSKAASSKVSDS